MPKRLSFLALLMLGYLFVCSCSGEAEAKKIAKSYTSWTSYLGGPDRNHYSTLSQITPGNVANLEVAWSYSAPDYGQMQMSPIIVDTILYGVSAAMRAFAIHAGTGEEIWRFGDTLKVWHSTSRGVSYWEKGEDKRILYTVGSDLFALNAMTGKPISTFGNNGKIDLRSGLPERAKDLFVISNTPGTIYKDLIVMPLRISEAEGAAPGDVMAFNVINGAVEWVFHTIPYPDEPGSETWESWENIETGIVGAANNWAGMAVDEALEIIYVPTGSAAPDFYGGVRKGSNLYANCLLALNANTGERLWHFQFTHHDIWDRDPPAPPNLITVERNGKKIAAVAQVTKQGYVFVFDRKTGVPLFDIEERVVPTISTLEGETPWTTQPFPVSPKPFARQSDQLTENDISPYAPNLEELKTIFRQADKRIYAPPGLDPVFLLPGYDGAAEWGGAGADPEDGILYVNSNEMAWIMQMEKKDPLTQEMPLGERTYSTYCATCHQKGRQGISASGFPSLIEIGKRRTEQEILEVITQGKGMMTGFPQIPKEEKEALLDYLFEIEDKKEVASEMVAPATIVPYKHKGYTKFLDANGLPGISPPWGTLHAIDLNSGDYIWSVPFGETDSLKTLGHPKTGTENYGGPVITENGLLFIGASKDGYFRAFDKKTGLILWEFKLPAAAFATPATYEVNGKQYVVIACGGEKLGTPKGNQLVAFALP